jgi:hypothetical protein
MDPGPKSGQINAVEATNSKEKGTPMLVLDLTIEYNGEQRPRKDWVVTEGPGSGKFDQLLRAIGEDDLADQIKAGEGPPVDTDIFLGQTVIVVTDKSVGKDGKLRDGVDSYLKP